MQCFCVYAPFSHEAQMLGLCSDPASNLLHQAPAFVWPWKRWPSKTQPVVPTTMWDLTTWGNIHTNAFPFNAYLTTDPHVVTLGWAQLSEFGGFFSAPVSYAVTFEWWCAKDWLSLHHGTCLVSIKYSKEWHVLNRWHNHVWPNPTDAYRACLV